MRHGWPWIFAIFLVACAEKKEETKNGWGGYPIPIYSDAEITSTEEGARDFQAALAFWEQGAEQKLFDYLGVWQGDSPYTGTPSSVTGILANVIFFLNPWPLDPYTAGQTVITKSKRGFHGAVIMLNPQIPLCGGDCRGDYSQTSRQKLIAHELGHFIGLGHIPEENNIMNPVLTPGGSLLEVSVDRVQLKQVISN
jgi:hypothetical protein